MRQVTSRFLKDLNPFGMRPGMFIGSTSTTGLHHLIWEVVDNSVDEAMQGFCTRIDVALLADGGCRVIDNGRGIPTGPHAVGSNKERRGDCADRAACRRQVRRLGLQGLRWAPWGWRIGRQRACRLGSILQIDRDGKRYEMSFEKGGNPTGPLKVIGDAPRGRTGTTVTFWPDGTIFDEIEFRAQTVIERLQMMAFLQPESRDQLL